jgi:hypothetical protein
VKETYKMLCENIPEFKQFMFKDFKEMLQIMLSRAFGKDTGTDQGVDINVTYMVPLADMGNHKMP